MPRAHTDAIIAYVKLALQGLVAGRVIALVPGAAYGEGGPSTPGLPGKAEKSAGHFDAAAQVTQPRSLPGKPTRHPTRERSLVQILRAAYGEVVFFEPLPAGEETVAARLPERPPWSGPPALETGAVLAVEQTVARSANVVIRLPTIRVFRPGCMLDVEVVSRRGGLSEDDWWDLHTSSHGGGFYRSHGGPLPRKLLRLGVRYADGSKATTIEQLRRWAQARDRDEPPAGPLLSWTPGSSGMHGRELGFSAFGLWLWPLPPAESFEFAAEWPFGGIGVSIIELDGAAIVAAASRSAQYWPGADQASQP